MIEIRYLNLLELPLRKRPINSETIEKFISKIVMKSRRAWVKVKFQRLLLENLLWKVCLTLDKVAYVRFASVYKNFNEAKDFEQFVGNLDETNHNYFLNLAFNLAKINLGKTQTNPSVGCVVVKNGCVVSSGYTSKNGRPHAEVNALKKSINFNKCNIYITMEPCTHYGQTPPCTNIIKKKILKKFIILLMILIKEQLRKHFQF